MSPTPHALEQLLKEFSQLPGIGPKTAERLVYYLLKKPKNNLLNFAASLKKVHAEVGTCSVCFRFADQNPCQICTDSKRDHHIICVVAASQNIPALEKTHAFHGLYHVLGGLINPLEGITPDQIRFKELINRLKTNGVQEVILALNPDINGETTNLYLSQMIKPLKIKVTRLARGLPMGADLEYADEITLENALKERREL
ncbi:recombination mediator RecR [Patescibacteria group bacterium]|nr:recombination mediator RecR [Patescibacteria group bacterium]